MVLHPTYFPNISHGVAMANSEAIVFEVFDNYQKQTYRNRCDIYGANGKLTLTVPVSYTQKNRQLYKDVRIHNEEKWQLHHLKSLQSAYRTSPFFEYYEDDLRPLFNTKFEFLLDFNFKCIDILLECLQLDLSYSLTDTFLKDIDPSVDMRGLVNPTTARTLNFESYTQVFQEKHGYINNLSILDLIFNEGPNAPNYLQSQTLHML